MKNLFKSLAAFQQEVPCIHKDTKGYGYSYADLPTIFDVINPLLSKHGLGFTQLVNGSSVKTIIFHIASGETIESVTDIPQGVELKGMNDFQVLGSAITYIRRYALSSALGIVTDKDTDAAGTQTKKTEQKKEVLTITHPDYKKIVDAIILCKRSYEDAKDRYSFDEKIDEALSKAQIDGIKNICDAANIDDDVKKNYIQWFITEKKTGRDIVSGIKQSSGITFVNNL